MRSQAYFFLATYNLPWRHSKPWKVAILVAFQFLWELIATREGCCLPVCGACGFLHMWTVEPSKRLWCPHPSKFFKIGKAVLYPTDELAEWDRKNLVTCQPSRMVGRARVSDG